MDNFYDAPINIINAATRKGKDGRKLLIQHRLELNTMRMVVFCDSSFTNMFVSSTQLGYVIVITDNKRREN